MPVGNSPMNSSNLPYYSIDTFISPQCGGNPTGVFLVGKFPEAAGMHRIAAGLDFPVTVFVEPGIKEHAAIRYFTATGEIPACGHATLAAAGLLLDQHPGSPVSFRTNAGVCITISMADGVLYMAYPKYPLETVSLGSDMLNALKIADYRYAGFCKELETLFIELPRAAILRTVDPDHRRLIKCSDTIKEVVITSVSDDPQYDFLLRSFCPWIGIDEDPVTGSVHSVLVPYWMHRTGRQEMKAYQASERGGEVFVRSLDDSVLIGGKIRISGYHGTEE